MNLKVFICLNERVVELFTQPRWFSQKSLYEWVTDSFRIADSFRNKASDCLNKWVTESLVHSICSNGWFSQ